MPSTTVNVQDTAVLINGRPVYADLPGSYPAAHGLLMNARFIQGIFDDKADPARFARFGHAVWDAEDNTDRLIAALPAWYAHGLRAFTVGLQGGGPCFTLDDWSSIDNNPFGPDGTILDAAYAGRLDRLIRAADALGMVVIVSFFYASQAPRLRDGRAVRHAVIRAANFLRDGGYTNVIIEVANEYNLAGFQVHPIIQTTEGIASLIDLARHESGGMLTGSSGSGNHANREVAEASDIILIHGNGTYRQQYYSLVQRVQSWGLNRPIVCNEDSPRIGNLRVAFQTGTSWGYYSNPTKQEPPADWSIMPGQDAFFARRMAAGIGIDLPPLPREAHYDFEGFAPHIELDGKRWLHVAALYPERVDYVEYFCNGALVDRAYGEPFYINYMTTWRHEAVVARRGDVWLARIVETDGNVVELRAEVD